MNWIVLNWGLYKYMHAYWKALPSVLYLSVCVCVYMFIKNTYFGASVQLSGTAFREALSFQTCVEENKIPITLARNNSSFQKGPNLVCPFFGQKGQPCLGTLPLRTRAMIFVGLNYNALYRNYQEPTNKMVLVLESKSEAPAASGIYNLSVYVIYI